MKFLGRIENVENIPFIRFSFLINYFPYRPGHTSLRGYQRLPEYKRQAMEIILGTFDLVFLQLAEGLMQINPQERISASEAMATHFSKQT